MSKLQFSPQKSLRLENVLKYKVLLDEEDMDLRVMIEQMQSYINAKGATQVGPLIQYTRTYLNEEDELDMEIVMMLQCNHYIHNVEAPYKMESLLRVKDCMYCRYMGPEESMTFAYDKINLEAFEQDIKLKGDSYTIYVDEQDDNMVIDVFMERAEDE